MTNTDSTTKTKKRTRTPKVNQRLNNIGLRMTDTQFQEVMAIVNEFDMDKSTVLRAAFKFATNPKNKEQFEDMLRNSI